MKCFCCTAEVSAARKAVIRRLGAFDANTAPGGQKAYQLYLEGMAYRSDAVCPSCYAWLDSAGGTAKVGSLMFDLADVSRFGAAPLFES
jgi:hypothetical protein